MLGRFYDYSIAWLSSSLATLILGLSYVLTYGMYPSWIINRYSGEEYLNVTLEVVDCGVAGDDPTRIHTLRKYVGQAEDQ